MKFFKRFPAIPGTLIALAATLLGCMMTVVLIASMPVHAPATRVSLFSRPGVAAIGLTLLLLGLVVGLLVLRELADRDYNTDRDFLNAFLEHIPDHVYFKDRHSRFLRVNRALANSFGLSDPGEATAKTDSDMFTPEHAGRALEDEQKIIETGRGITGMEEKETWPDGHESWVLTTKVPLKDRRGRILGTMGISRDITDRKAGGVAHPVYGATRCFDGAAEPVASGGFAGSCDCAGGPEWEASRGADAGSGPLQKRERFIRTPYR